VPHPDSSCLDDLRRAHPEKFAPKEEAFRRIFRGSHIFIGTGCGEPQHLVNALVEYVAAHPVAFFDAEILHVWTLGVAPYTDEKFRQNFRHNSFFIANNTRDAVNKGVADYSPASLSQVPGLFRSGLVPIDVALIQTSLPDSHGYMSLGVSVDIVKGAVEQASLVIAQVNCHMPRTHGHGFVHVDDVDFLVPYDEPLLEYSNVPESDVAQKLGQYVARLVQDGDTIQVGYGSLPNAIMANLKDKRNLGVHTELFSDGLAELMRLGVVDNTLKTVHRGKTVATFCMGSRSTYEYIHDNPAVEFRTIDYTNDPMVIAQNRNMTAINSALEIDLTGQATADSLGKTFFSGVGGQADFMRGAVLAEGGRTILALGSTAENGTISRIVPFLKEGAGVTLNRCDTQYVVTEFGIAYLRGKNVRERAMELIGIAHPKFRPWLIEEARRRNIIFKDQAFIPGKRGEYPVELETYRTTKMDVEVFLRPVKISDEPLLKDFFYSLSDDSMYRRFMSHRKDMPHERLQEFTPIDYTRQMVILAIVQENEKEDVVGLGQYGIAESAHTAEVAFVVRDDHQNQGIGHELLAYLTQLAKRAGLLGFTAEVLADNLPMLQLFESMGFDATKRHEAGVYELRMAFRG
jgi:acyl-CoA hydrolase/GNAT superfamily N-acetyltransferase